MTKISVVIYYPVYYPLLKIPMIYWASPTNTPKQSGRPSIWEPRLTAESTTARSCRKRCDAWTKEEPRALVAAKTTSRSSWQILITGFWKREGWRASFTKILAKPGLHGNVSSKVKVRFLQKKSSTPIFILPSLAWTTLLRFRFQRIHGSDLWKNSGLQHLWSKCQGMSTLIHRQ